MVPDNNRTVLPFRAPCDQLSKGPPVVKCAMYLSLTYLVETGFSLYCHISDKKDLKNSYLPIATVWGSLPGQEWERIGVIL